MKPLLRLDTTLSQRLTLSPQTPWWQVAKIVAHPALDALASEHPVVGALTPIAGGHRSSDWTPLALPARLEPISRPATPDQGLT